MILKISEELKEIFLVTIPPRKNISKYFFIKITKAFGYESFPFFGELGVGFECDFIAGKIDVVRHRKPQNPREKEFFTLFPPFGSVVRWSAFAFLGVD